MTRTDAATTHRRVPAADAKFSQVRCSASGASLSLTAPRAGSHGRDLPPVEHGAASGRRLQSALCAPHALAPRLYNTELVPVLDWAYLEDWCRRLTGNFQDVYVFTVPLYLPKQEADGKWRIVS